LFKYHNKGFYEFNLLEELSGMANIQEKVGQGLSKIQEGIEQGKHKLHVAQEVSKLKSKMANSSTKKAELLLNLGQTTYQLLRQGKLSNEMLMKLSSEITSIDKDIFEASLQVEELTKEEDTNMQCECGHELQSDTKFCGGCGKSVSKDVATHDEEKTTCTTCEVNIPASSSFCHCCGTKVEVAG
jgi:hypothetical protein